MTTSSLYCTFYLDKIYFGVDVLKVQEIIRYQPMTPVPLAAPAVSGLINLRGQIVTAIDLRRRLGLPPVPTLEQPMNVVLRTDEGAVSLLVDEIGDVVEVDETTAETPPGTIRGCARDLTSRVYKLGDHLLLVLDTDKAISVSGREG